MSIYTLYVEADFNDLAARGRFKEHHWARRSGHPSGRYWIKDDAVLANLFTRNANPTDNAPVLKNGDQIQFAVKDVSDAGATVSRIVAVFGGQRADAHTDAATPVKDGDGSNVSMVDKSTIRQGGGKGIRHGAGLLADCSVIGPFTIGVPDGAAKRKLKFEFVLAARLTVKSSQGSTSKEFSIDPEMDVDN